MNEILPLLTIKPTETRKYILGIDPGETSGFALAELDLPTRGITWPLIWEVDITEFSENLNYFKLVSLITCEDFTLRPDKQSEFLNRGYTSLKTAKLVGRVEQFGFVNGIPVRTPQAAEKPFAYKLIGLTYVKGKKDMHMADSKAHARNAIRKVWSI